MIKEIIVSTILTIIGVIITGTAGYLAGKSKDYRTKLQEKEDNEKLQNVALQILLQNQLTNTFFVYKEIGEIPDYVYKNWINSLNIYEKLGGNDYIHELAKRMEKMVIVETSILK